MFLLCFISNRLLVKQHFQKKRNSTRSGQSSTKFTLPIKRDMLQGMVVHIRNPSYLGSRGRRISSLRAAWGKLAWDYLKNKRKTSLLCEVLGSIHSATGKKKSDMPLRNLFCVCNLIDKKTFSTWGTSKSGWTFSFLQVHSYLFNQWLSL
jgi:hypothetical protein